MIATDIQYVKGVGPYLAKKLEKLSLKTSEDLLFYFPRSYDDRRMLPKISQVKADETVTLFVTIEALEEKKINKKLSLLKGRVKDATGSLRAVWFNQPFLKKQLTHGRLLVVKGKLENDPFTHHLQLKVSETEVVKSHDDIKKHIGAVFPIYSVTYGLTQVQLRPVVLEVVRSSYVSIPDPMPQDMRQKLNLIPLRDAIRELHLPSQKEAYSKARHRLVFDDFFYYQLQLAKRHTSHKEILKTEPLLLNKTLIDPYLSKLPYSLTTAQNGAIQDVFKDISSSSPMNRLLQGDVGAGKTEVAVVALLAAVESGKVGAFMAPTEILAVQHYLKLKQSLSELGVTVYLLKSKLKVAEKKKIIKALETECSVIVIGTHALIESNVSIPNLGLVVVDEQHRFGVIQRQKLQYKSSSPHCLFMTATPIPRTFMLTCFGDLDKSVIGELPPGRIPAKTHFVQTEDQGQFQQFLRTQLEEGAQIYCVYPLVAESEKLDLMSAEEGFEVYKNMFPTHSIAIVHGKMKPDEKSSVMEEFKKNKIQILIATTVIEVGVDVPNATVMVINHAERFGLSQLHQLRGRVGRGKKESFCFLVGETKTENSKKRIHALLSSNDGFELAEIDLNIRGPGDMLGTKQAGLPDFKLANLTEDEDILQIARKVAFSLIKTDPNLEKPGYHLIKKEMEKRQSIELGDSLN
jgi:ATP-dependent DNA helicase RecG